MVAASPPAHPGPGSTSSEVRLTKQRPLAPQPGLDLFMPRPSTCIHILAGTPKIESLNTTDFKRTVTFPQNEERRYRAQAGRTMGRRLFEGIVLPRGSGTDVLCQLNHPVPPLYTVNCGDALLSLLMDG